MSMRVAGSLWSVPEQKVRSEAARLTAAGLEIWHWDRADGSMGPAGGFSPAVALEIAEETKSRSEAHLMLADPRPELDEWLAFCELVIVHLESPHWRESVNHIRASGARAGIAVGPSSNIPPGLDEDLAILIMTVSPGHAGTGFLPQRLELLPSVSRHELRGVDGSINLERGRSARAHGANWLVSGTALTTAPDPRFWLAEVTTDLSQTRGS